MPVVAILFEKQVVLYLILFLILYRVELNEIVISSNSKNDIILQIKCYIKVNKE